MSSPNLAVQQYVQDVSNRLQEQGFRGQRDVVYADQTFAYVAHRVRWAWSKFGMEETFFVFKEFVDLDLPVLRHFSSKAFGHAMKSKTVPLPCGLYECVICYPVALVTGTAATAADAIRSEQPPKHWAAMEMPVIIDVNGHIPYYYEQTPMWGALYYAGFRKTIHEILVP
jgi:hypothetical protein